MTYGRLVIPRERKDALVFEYDCELAEWLPPFGWGRHADLRVERSRKDSEGLRTVSITALGRGNGFCHRKYDLGSELGSDFRVPEGTDFPQTEIVWRQIYDGMLNYLGEVDGPLHHALEERGRRTGKGCQGALWKDGLCRGPPRADLPECYPQREVP